MNITWKLTMQDAAAVIGVLDELPTKSGVWPLVQNLREQAEEQGKAAAKPQQQPEPAVVAKKGEPR